MRLQSSRKRSPLKKSVEKQSQVPRTKLPRLLTRKQAPRIAPSWWEKETRGDARLIVCSECRAVYFDKHWHTNPAMAKVLLASPGVERAVCTECSWKRQSAGKTVNYEGEVLLQNIPDEETKLQILRLVRNVGKRALTRDPEDQIIRIEDTAGRIRVTTTENQLAVAVGKQVARAFKGGDLQIKWSHEDAPARVVWNYKK
ncbi:MAG: hypothetical protein AAB562_03425 [Patescibacteria group bacterium]